MVLLDKKIFGGGIAMLVAGMIIASASGDSPAGESGMTEEEIIDLMVAEDESQAYRMLSGILVGVGFLLVLVSFGVRRRGRRSGQKKVEEGPAQG